MNCCRRVFKIMFLPIALLVSTAMAFAQEPPPTEQQSTDSAKPQDQAPPAKDDAPPQPTPVLNEMQSTANPPEIRGMNSAAPLPSGRVSPVQLGPLYLQSLSFFQSENAITVSGQPGTNWESVSVFRTNIVFDHSFKTSRVAVQYEPRLTIVNGQAFTDTSNLNGNWTTTFYASPRLNISIDDNLNYFGQQGQFDNLSLLADLTTGALVQSRFLDGSGHLLSNRAELPISYLVSPRGRLDITPFFEYYKATGSASISHSRSPGGRVSYGYALSATRGIGVSYSVQDTSFSSTLPTTLYQTIAANYSQILSPTLRYSIGAGATLSSATAATTSVSSTQSTVNATFNLIKSFRDSSLSFNYYRGQAAGLQITNGFADRFDLAYDRRLSQRTRASVAGGYYREFLSATDTSGYFFSGSLSYLLTQRWSVVTQYAYKHQANGGAAFENGNLHYIAAGVRWESNHHDSY